MQIAVVNPSENEAYEIKLCDWYVLQKEMINLCQKIYRRAVENYCRGEMRWRKSKLVKFDTRCDRW